MRDMISVAEINARAGAAVLALRKERRNGILGRPDLDLRYAIEDASAALDSLWLPIATAPRDGSGFLSYGRHWRDSVFSDGRVSWRKGDHWWAIILWDIWRTPSRGFVFAKDGARTWSDPLCWQPLLPPTQYQAATEQSA